MNEAILFKISNPPLPGCIQTNVVAYKRNPGQNNFHKEDDYIGYIWDHQRNLGDDLVTTFSFTYLVPKQVSIQTFKYV